jgi:hypothetical protein
MVVKIPAITQCVWNKFGVPEGLLCAKLTESTYPGLLSLHQVNLLINLCSFGWMHEDPVI